MGDGGGEKSRCAARGPQANPPEKKKDRLYDRPGGKKKNLKKKETRMKLARGKPPAGLCSVRKKGGERGGIKSEGRIAKKKKPWSNPEGEKVRRKKSRGAFRKKRVSDKEGNNLGGESGKK